MLYKGNNDANGDNGDGDDDNADHRVVPPLTLFNHVPVPAPIVTAEQVQTITQSLFDMLEKKAFFNRSGDRSSVEHDHEPIDISEAPRPRPRKTTPISYGLEDTRQSSRSFSTAPAYWADQADGDGDGDGDTYGTVTQSEP